MSGPLPAILAPVTIPASWLYAAVVAARNRRYDNAGGKRLPRPVISVGNLTAGGVGKTPMVMWILRRLVDAGHRPAVAMRGYDAPSGGISDEQAEYGRRLPDVPVVADPRRHEAVSAFIAGSPDTDCIVLDDGFQHRQLERDLDLVLVDRQAATLRDRMLPAGWLREPVARLERADAVIVTHAESIDEPLARAVERHHGRPPMAWTAHRWTGLESPRQDGPPEMHPVDWLAGRRVLTMLGVGRPRRIHEQLERIGATVSADVPVRDHERYTTARVTVARGLCDGVEAMVVTAKDWVKLRHLIDLASWPVPVVVPVLELEFLAGEDDLREAVLRIVRPQAPGLGP